MCNDYRLEVDIASVMEDFDNLKIKVDEPEGRPNVEAREDIQITDIAPIVRSTAGGGELITRRWSWPGYGAKSKPVYNYQAEKREFTSHRCLIIADGFYEFTTPEDPKQKRKNKWLFTLPGHDWFCIAGIWRAHPEVSEAFTMLTIAAGPDVKPYHDRQIVPLPRDRWAAWLDPEVPAQEVLKALPAGGLDVTRVYPPKSPSEPDPTPTQRALL